MGEFPTCCRGQGRHWQPRRRIPVSFWHWKEIVNSNCLLQLVGNLARGARFRGIKVLHDAHLAEVRIQKISDTHVDIRFDKMQTPNSWNNSF